jgi:signal peptidase
VVAHNTLQINLYGYGASMCPTLREGDILDVAACEHLSVGDVVVFPAVDPNRSIAHRVVSISSSGVRTRGDNVDYIDSRILQLSEITGFVVSAKRGCRTQNIIGGRRGILYARVLWKWNPVYNRLVAIAGFAYRRLSYSGIFRRLIPFRVTPKVVSFKRPNGLEMRLLWGKRVIGRRMPGDDKWQLRPPFRLFVDETILPK